MKKPKPKPKMLYDYFFLKPCLLCITQITGKKFPGIIKRTFFVDERFFCDHKRRDQKKGLL